MRSRRSNRCEKRREKREETFSHVNPVKRAPTPSKAAVTSPREKASILVTNPPLVATLKRERKE